MALTDEQSAQLAALEEVAAQNGRLIARIEAMIEEIVGLDDPPGEEGMGWAALQEAVQWRMSTAVERPDR